MSIPMNLMIDYYAASDQIHRIYEVDHLRNRHGIYVDWHPNGIMWEESYYVHGDRHGISKFCYDTGKLGQVVEYRNGQKEGLALYWDVDTQCYLNYYYFNGQNITERISYMVKDIKHITDQEKTQIALQTGLML